MNRDEPQRRAAPRRRVTPRGEFDLFARRALLDDVIAACEAGADVDIDLRFVDHIDSSGLAWLIEVDRTVGERRGRPARFLVAEGSVVHRMLELTLLYLTLEVRIA